MKPAPFRYHAPATKDEALALLSRYRSDEARVIAGGQSLVPMMALRVARPAHLVDINRIPGLGEIRIAPDALTVGPCTRHARFERPVEDGPTGRMLAEVCRAIGHAPIRTRGTFGGSLAHADPASEWCMVAVGLGAELTLERLGHRRTVAASAFFQGIMTTALEPDELLSEVRLPRLPPDAAIGFHEVSRRKGDFALTAALAILRIVEGRVAEARLVLAGAEDRPRRLDEAERILAGKIPADPLFVATARAAAHSIEPLTDHEIDADLRRRLVETEMLHALRAAHRQAAA